MGEEKTSPAEKRQEIEKSLQGGDLAIFSEEVTKLLVKEAQRALELSPLGGIEWALCLLNDAQKYNSIYPYARSVGTQELYEITQKIRHGNTVLYNDRQPT